MRKHKTLQLLSLKKNKNYYTGEVLIWFDAVKCMQGEHVKFKQKIIPKKLERFVGKDISKWKSMIYVDCIISDYGEDTSMITDGGEDYEVSTGLSGGSKVKIIAFKSLRYNKGFFY